MNKKKLSKFSLAAFAVLAAIALLLIFSTAEESPKTKTALIGFVVLMLYGCYRSFVHINDSDNSSEANKIVDKLMKKRTIQGFFAVIFNPLDTRFRTILSLYIILLVKLYCNATLTNSTIVVFIIAKCCMFRVYYNLWKKIQDALAKDNISNETDEEIDEQLIENMKKLADCRTTYFASSYENQDEIRKAYAEAKERGKRENFIPLIMLIDHNLYEAITDQLGTDYENPDIEKVRAKRNELISNASTENAKIWLDDELQEIVKYYGEDYKDIVGSPTDDATAYNDFGITMNDTNQPVLLVEVPVTEPWQTLAWFPFGGWNECPNAENLVNTVKYWYEKYGAIPTIIKSDVLEMQLESPIDKEQSLELAQEQYVFCCDCIEQGHEYIHALADSLRKSTVWYFWWD